MGEAPEGCACLLLARGAGLGRLLEPYLPIYPLGTLPILPLHTCLSDGPGQAGGGGSPIILGSHWPHLRPPSADIRETAFVFAITAAGASHAVTQACSMGELLQCGCQAPRGRAPPRPSGLLGTPGPPGPTGSPDASAAWEWGGCGDDVDFGDEKSRLFMDAQHKRGRGDIRALVQLHNNEAGRLVRTGRRCRCRVHECGSVSMQESASGCGRVWVAACLR